MILYEKSLTISKLANKRNLLQTFTARILSQLPDGEIPVRCVVTESNVDEWQCELGVMAESSDQYILNSDFIFKFRRRQYENCDAFNIVLIVPTGIDAEIGGDAGDAGPVARLLSGSCDNLITHPNVVNASDINELPDKGLYVEGSVLTRLLMGTVGLQKVRSNRVLVVLDKHEDKFFYEAAVNSVSAARSNLGLNCPSVVLMDEKISMQSLYSNSGRAVGSITHLERLCDLLNTHRSQFDAIALSSVIQVPPECHADYFTTDMINPWGGVEALLTHTISSIFTVPSAHSPMLEERGILNLDVGIVDPRKSAEAVSTTYLHCILKGLHKSPKIIESPRLDGESGLLTVADVSCIVIPYGCIGLPTLAAIEQGITVIAVKENTNRMRNRLEDLPFANGQLHVVDNYLEAVGVIQAIKSGVAIDSVRRPMEQTNVVGIEQKKSTKSTAIHGRPQEEKDQIEESKRSAG